MKEKVFIAWSFTSSPVAWSVPGVVSLEDVKNIIASNNEDLALVSAKVETVDCDTIMALRREDVKFVMKLEQDPYITGGVDSEPYYTASATCGDFKYEIEWDILPDIDMGKQDDESIYCDWDAPERIFAYGESPNLDLDEIELLWD